MIIDVYAVYGRRGPSSPNQEILACFRNRSEAEHHVDGRQVAQIVKRQAVCIGEDYYLLEGPVDVDQVKERRNKTLVAQALKKLSDDELGALRREFKK
jgi:hypothetical protein